MKSPFSQGSYGYDAEFLSKNNIDFIELNDPGSKATVLIVPGYQGRVMTSSVSGDEGTSYGWINYSLIESGEKNDQFNPYGGEERFWLGPEGGDFSIYFEEGEEQEFPNWNVPKFIDTEPFDLISQSPQSVSFQKDFTLRNASGTQLHIGIERKVRILSRGEADHALAVTLDTSLSFVGYESENVLINRGEFDWDRSTGALSIWMLSMFNPSEKGVVVIPFHEGKDMDLGKIVTDDYFGKVPSDRLITRNGLLLFKTDGKFRSKIGLSPYRALPYCGSYDSENQVLTLLKYSQADQASVYVNSKWGAQEDPFLGDVLNAYNDGPVEDGSIMGPFYEIESSSPAALISAGNQISHTQQIFHITGEENKLSFITEKLFGMTINDIKEAFEKKEIMESTNN
ncbi:MAG: hypothetical protein E4H10_03455 [Bacteroidia bacterium]|nr:MAG: hypothetical protein E4H10_03455 [Bacteroidia bacterium]